MSIFDIFKSINKPKEESEPLPDIKELIKNEISITHSDEKPKENESKFGGKPYLPSDFTWPYYNSEDYDGVKKNRPLSFLAQISLDEIRPFDKDGILPEKGMLFFFYEIETMKWGFDPEDEGCARVYYFEKTEGFTALNPPNDLSADYVLPELAIEFGSGISLPCYEELGVHSSLFSDLGWEDYERLATNLGVNTQTCERSKLLGYADLIQGEALTDCEATARGIYMGDGKSYQKLTEAQKSDIKAHAADWVLLFQMASICDTDPEIMWGDLGNLYFYIKKSDLAAGRFDKIRLTLQCG